MGIQRASVHERVHRLSALRKVRASQAWLFPFHKSGEYLVTDHAFSEATVRKRGGHPAAVPLTEDRGGGWLLRVGFFFRKRKSLGRGFALNFSNRGVSLSGGIKGLRLSSRGNISAGRKGISFRKKL